MGLVHRVPEGGTVLEGPFALIRRVYVSLCSRYLNQQHIKKQKVSEAELTYGSLSIDQSETIKEIGELGLDIWRKQMIEPLR